MAVVWVLPTPEVAFIARVLVAFLTKVHILGVHVSSRSQLSYLYLFHYVV